MELTQILHISELAGSDVKISFMKVKKEHLAICFEKAGQKVIILGSTYFNILYLRHAVNMIYDRCKNHTIEIKNKLLDFVNIFDACEDKWQIYNKITNSDKFKNNILDFEVLACCLNYMMDCKKKIIIL